MRPGVLLVLLVVAGPAALAAGEHSSDAMTERWPGWVLFDYVGGSDWTRVRFNATFTGPGILFAEAHYASGGIVDARLIYAGRQVQATVNGNSATPARLAFGAAHGIGLAPNESARVVIYGVSERDPWSWEPFLAPGATLTRIASGTDTLFSTGRSPTTGTHAHAAAIVGASVSNASYAFDVERRFLGVVGAVETVVRDQIMLVKPDGTREGCPCFEWFEPRLAGRYKIEWDGVAVGDQQILLAGVDIEGIPIARSGVSGQSDR